MIKHPSNRKLKQISGVNYMLRRKPQPELPGISNWRTLLVAALGLCTLVGGPLAAGPTGTGVLLPDGREFVSWEKPLEFSKTYFVDNNNTRTADTNPGSKELPFSTINRAAQVLQPGERVLIMVVFIASLLILSVAGPAQKMITGGCPGPMLSKDRG
jgi:hypothetical protein